MLFFLVYSGHKKLLLSLLSHIDPVQTILGLVKGSTWDGCNHDQRIFPTDSP